MKKLTSAQYDTMFEVLEREGFLILDPLHVQLTEEGAVEVAKIIATEFNFILAGGVDGKTYAPKPGNEDEALREFVHYTLGTNQNDISKNSIAILVDHYARLAELH